jgi:acyl carrier protein
MSLECIFAEVFAIPERTVNEALVLRAISTWDSMTHMIMIARIEEAFQVEFTGDEIADFQTFADIRKALEQRDAG